MPRRDHRAIALKAARSRARRRLALGIAPPMCARCGGPRDRPSSTYCRGCHAANMREWRKLHPPNAEQRGKDSARSMAGIYKRRGRLVPQPCARCGAPDAEMHHPDYGKPLEVEWLCRSCHLTLHNPAPYSICSGCGAPRDTAGAYCKACRAAYMRNYRERQAHRGNRKSSKGLRDDAEANSRKRKRGVSRDTSAAGAAGKEQAMSTSMIPDAGLGPQPAEEIAPAGPDPPRRQPAVVAPWPPPRSPDQRPAAEAADPVAAARQRNFDRVQRLMKVAKALGIAAVQLETLTGAIIAGAAPEPRQSEPDQQADHFFEAIDHLIDWIEPRTARVAHHAATLDRVFDLNVKRPT